MRARWDFIFESKGFTFDRAYHFVGTVKAEQAEAFDLQPKDFNFDMSIEPDPSLKWPGSDQAGKLKITLPGNDKQTKNIAAWIAVHAAEQISFFQGALKINSGLIMGELLPDTPEEAEQLGENRFFGEMNIVEWRPPKTFDSSSFDYTLGNSATGILMRQYNTALKTDNPIDQFLGLFRILEDLYGPTAKKQTLAQALKASVELLAIASLHLTYRDESASRSLTSQDYFDLVDKIVKTRHECAHLRTNTGFGIPHGDPRVKSDVEPLIKPLNILTFEAIRFRMHKAENASE